MQQQKHWAGAKAPQHLHCFTFAQHLTQQRLHSFLPLLRRWLFHAQVYGEDKALQYVVPSPNVRIECPLALVDKVLDNRPAAAREAAAAFCNFLFTPEAQVRRRWQGVGDLCVACVVLGAKGTSYP